MKGLKACPVYFQIQLALVYYTKASLLAAQAQDRPVPRSFWPSGTTATGSTTHLPLNSNSTGFPSSYAIDGRTDTLWNE